jgi:hypothetical protein
MIINQQNKHDPCTAALMTKFIQMHTMRKNQQNSPVVQNTQQRQPPLSHHCDLEWSARHFINNMQEWLQEFIKENITKAQQYLDSV